MDQRGRLLELVRVDSAHQGPARAKAFALGLAGADPRPPAKRGMVNRPDSGSVRMLRLARRLSLARAPSG